MFGTQNSTESAAKSGEAKFNFLPNDGVKISAVGFSNPLPEVPFLAKPKPEIPIFVSEVVEETAEIIWELRGVSDSTKYMALGNQAKCFIEVGESIGFPIKLCLYMKQNGIHCKVDSWPFSDARKNDILLRFELSTVTSTDGSKPIAPSIFVNLGESNTVVPELDEDGNISCLVRESVLTHSSAPAKDDVPAFGFGRAIPAPSSE